MLSKIPMNRFLKVEEAAALVSWLASEDYSFTTGLSSISLVVGQFIKNIICRIMA